MNLVGRVESLISLQIDLISLTLLTLITPIEGTVSSSLNFIGLFFTVLYCHNSSV